MNRHLLLVALACEVFAPNILAQTSPLVDPAKAPVRLNGAWTSASGTNRSGEVNVYIDKINPDGTFTGKLDFLGGRNCKAMGESIKEGRITAEEIRVVASGGATNTCGDITLVLKRGTSKFLEGQATSQQGGGNPIWLDAPK
jgi:hypothetical protein